MYHILYETTNLINGKKYIGIHSSEVIDDSYLGSGVAIKRAIEKHGKENFERKIISLHASRKELLKAETLYVTEDIVNDKNYYNMQLGGMSYIDSLIAMSAESFYKHQSKAGKIGGKVAYENMSAETKKSWHSKGGKSSINSGGYKMSESGKINISESRKNSKKYICPICKGKAMDGGNFNKHMNFKHQIPKEDCYQWRAGAEVDD